MSAEGAGVFIAALCAFVVAWLSVTGLVAYLNGRERAAQCAAAIHAVPVERWHGGVPPAVRCP